MSVAAWLHITSFTSDHHPACLAQSNVMDYDGLMADTDENLGNPHEIHCRPMQPYPAIPRHGPASHAVFRVTGTLAMALPAKTSGRDSI